MSKNKLTLICSALSCVLCALVFCSIHSKYEDAAIRIERGCVGDSAVRYEHQLRFNCIGVYSPLFLREEWQLKSKTMINDRKVSIIKHEYY